MSHQREIKIMYDNLLVRYQALKTEIGILDMKEQDILHFIENTQYDAVTGAKVLKLLKENRVNRRELKMEYQDLQSLLSRMESAGLDKVRGIPTGYSYRTNIVDNLIQNQPRMVANLR